METVTRRGSDVNAGCGELLTRPEATELARDMTSVVGGRDAGLRLSDRDERPPSPLSSKRSSSPSSSSRSSWLGGLPICDGMSRMTTEKRPRCWMRRRRGGMECPWPPPLPLPPVLSSSLLSSSRCPAGSRPSSLLCSSIGLVDPVDRCRDLLRSRLRWPCVAPLSSIRPSESLPESSPIISTHSSRAEPKLERDLVELASDMADMAPIDCVARRVSKPPAIGGGITPDRPTPAAAAGLALSAPAITVVSRVMDCEDRLRGGSTPPDMPKWRDLLPIDAPVHGAQNPAAPGNRTNRARAGLWVFVPPHACAGGGCCGACSRESGRRA